MIANATGCSSIYGGNLPTTPYYGRRATAAAPPGATRCSRTMRNSAWGSAWPSTRNGTTPSTCSSSWRARWGTSWSPICLNRPSKTSWNWPLSGGAWPDCVEKLRAINTPEALHLAGLADSPGRPERLDPGRRWLGLRHRLRRPRPRPDHRPGRQPAGTRHGRLFEHRRASLQVDPAGGRGQIRRLGKTVPQEGLGHDRRGLRQRLCRPNRDRGQPGAGGQGLSGGRIVSRRVADPGLLPNAWRTAST